MLRLPESMADEIVAHARADHPIEACGVIAGPAGSGRPERLIRLRNAEPSTDFYRIDPMDQLRLYRELEERGEEIVVVYHSHTSTQAYPSRTDIDYAGEPQAHYVLVSTRSPDTTELRSFRILGGEVTEEDVEILAADGAVTRPDRA